jgi:uncharacterized protein YqeY
MEIANRLKQDMKEAMVARDSARLSALRLIRAELLTAEKEKGESPDQTRAIAILQKMLKQRQDSMAQFASAGREDLAAAERAEAAVIEGYLPASLSEAEIDAAIDAVLAGSPAQGAAALGQVMGPIMAKLKETGKPFDGKWVNQRVRQRLGG